MLGTMKPLTAVAMRTATQARPKVTIAAKASRSGERLRVGRPREGAEPPREPAAAEEHHHEADDGEGVRNARDQREMVRLAGRERASTERVNGHGQDAAERAGDEGDSGLTIVCHVPYYKDRSRPRKGVFGAATRSRTKGA